MQLSSRASTPRIKELNWPQRLVEAFMSPALTRETSLTSATTPQAEADQCVVVFPTADLIKLCRGIKTADRELRISDGLGKVTTFRKSSNEVKETPVQFSSIAFPGARPGGSNHR